MTHPLALRRAPEVSRWHALTGADNISELVRSPSVTFCVRKDNGGDSFRTDSQLNIGFWQELWWVLLPRRLVLPPRQRLICCFHVYSSFYGGRGGLLSTSSPSVWTGVNLPEETSARHWRPKYETCRLTRWLMQIERCNKLARDSQGQPIITPQTATFCQRRSSYKLWTLKI